MKNLWKYIIISVALVLCAIVLATAYTHQSRTATGTISVTGLGETEFTSDVIVVKGTISCQNPDIAQGYLDIEAAKQRLVDFLAEYGIKAEEISFSMLNYYKQNESVYRDGDYIGERFKHYSLSQRFSIESRDVDGLESAAQNITSLIGEGYMLDVDDPMYYYTKLNDVKHDLIAKAAADARERANKIASSSNAELGDLRNSRTGVFQITAATGDEEFSAGGSFNLSSREKKARVTVRAEYKIKNK